MYPKVRGFGLANNGPFWAHHITNVFIPYIRVLRDVYLKRLVPAFEDAGAEADKVSDEVWERLGRTASADADPGDLAEMAHDAGIDHYMMLVDARQTLANLFAVALHHLVEQQQLFILRRELLHPKDEDNPAAITRERFVAELQAQGIDPTAYPSWELLEDLRFVANSVKHGDGASVNALKKRRPLFFTNPLLRHDPEGVARDAAILEFHRVYQPLAGDDLYVTDDDLRQFFQAAEDFWTALARDFYRVAGFDER